MPVLNFVIRDGTEADIADCCLLDHSYETDYVWQVSFTPDTGGYRVLLRQERLPRAVTTIYSSSETRLRHACEAGGLVVAVERDTDRLLAYLTLRYDPYNQITFVRDLVVDRPKRRLGVATRLFSVARLWAREKTSQFLTVELQNKNYPASQFCVRQGLDFSGFNDKHFSDHEIALFFTQLI